MILRTDITEAGVFNKPHGIKGEISATLDYDTDLSDVKCIVIEIEGIFVPFFIVSVRPKTAETCLLTIDGIDSEEKARTLTGRAFYLLNSDLPVDDPDGEEGFYASDMVGYTVTDSELGTIGEITDEKEVYIPVADDFINEIDQDTHTLHTTLPQGIVDLNN